MSDIDHMLTSEYFEECEPLTSGSIGWVKGHGITAQTMIELQGPRHTKVRFESDCFELDPGGDPALVIPCWRDGTFYDLLAWNASQSATRLHREAILGFGVLGTWNDHLRPLRVHTGVLGWLQSGLDGIVILEPESAWRILWTFNHFQAESVEHGEYLQRVLKAPDRGLDIQIPVKEAA